MGNPYNAECYPHIWALLQNVDDPILGAFEMDGDAEKSSPLCAWWQGGFVAVFRKAHAFLAEGAVDLVYGCNIYRHSKSNAVVKAFISMIHHQVSADDAWHIYKEFKA